MSFRMATLAGAAALLAVPGCVLGSEDGPAGEDGPEPEAGAAPIGPADVEALGLEGTVDEVVVMQPGGFVQLDRDHLGVGEIRQARHILRASSPNGPLDLFELMVIDRAMGQGLHQCRLLQESSGASMSCGPIEDPAGGASLLMGTMSSEELIAYELVGPPETTHFIVVEDDWRTALVAVEGQAVLVSRGQGGRCPPIPSLIEAWAGEELVVSESPEGWC